MDPFTKVQDDYIAKQCLQLSMDMAEQNKPTIYISQNGVKICPKLSILKASKQKNEMVNF